jgi:cytochrome c oxidase cbb3-type subunit III
MIRQTRALSMLAGALLLALFGLGIYRVAAQADTPTPSPQQQLGAKLFAENCAVCHGPEGKGRVGATLAQNWPSIRPDLTVKAIITNGVSGSPMPAWSQSKGGPLSDVEIDALVQYILSWQTGGAPQYTPEATATLRPPITPLAEVTGDPNKGALLFDQNCVMCHGAQGRGKIGATLAKSWSGVRPDLLIQATITNGVPNSPMPAWGQARGGPLSEAEINDLTAFVLTLAGNPVQVVEAPTPTPAFGGGSQALRGWGGVLLIVVILVVVIGAALFLQRQK